MILNLEYNVEQPVKLLLFFIDHFLFVNPLRIERGKKKEEEMHALPLIFNHWCANNNFILKPDFEYSVH